MASEPSAARPISQSSQAPAARPPVEDGPFVLRSLLDDVPLSADASEDDIRINCVDYLDDNLYVGTSASELLHFVKIPPDPSDPTQKPVFIEASRLKPLYVETSGAFATSRPGVQQILLLPSVGKACILCNWTVTFYSLPEMSPFLDTTQVKNCNWIGGINLNGPADTSDPPDGMTVLLSLNRRIQIVRIGDTVLPIKKIDFAGSTLTVRRGPIACVADSKAYSLLDVDRQLKIPLMKISWLDESTSGAEFGQAQTLGSGNEGGLSRSTSTTQNRSVASNQSHNRSTSLGASFLGNIRRQDPRVDETEGLTTVGASSPSASTSPQPQREAVATPPPQDKPLPFAPSRTGTPTQKSERHDKPGSVFLKPHIVSPSPEEFLVVTGTSPLEPGIGMFVNLDGDPPTRPTLEFERYPKEVVVDVPSAAELAESGASLAQGEDGYALASMAKEFEGGLRHGLEIQKLDPGPDAAPQRHWLEATQRDATESYGIRAMTGREETHFQEIVERLAQRKYAPFQSNSETSNTSLKSVDSRTALSMERQTKEKELFEQNFDSQDEDSLPDGWEATRTLEGEELPRRLAKTAVRLTVWSGATIWWAVRNPLIVQIDAALDCAYVEGLAKPGMIDRQVIFNTLTSLRDSEARTELEFMTFDYMRQKAGLLLLTSLLSSSNDLPLSTGETNILEEVLVGSKLDARVVLSLIPGVRNEIVEGRRGIWIYGGVKRAAEAFLRGPDFEAQAKTNVGALDRRTIHFLRRFLASWRKMKGFGSVPDENEVSRTVDAALLLVLLEVDQHSPRGPGKGGAIRTELNELVDKGVECFERAVDLLESYHRLFVLSRLYQSRKMAGDVLATWRRIIEGEEDAGQELQDGEQQVRGYLSKISNKALVQEYGLWLANRNPRLGVQVFAEDRAKIRFEPTSVVEMLKEGAPDAVRYYLEHLVFGKGHKGYVNELIAYYMDVVIQDLQSSEESRERVMATYDAYRALQAPKPTYSHFLTDNAPPDDEAWHSRLRLLQLLSGDHDFDGSAIRARIAQLPGDLLVPETIILAGREHQDEDALRLLVHRLGDYDTAVSYCLRGGASIYNTNRARPSSNTDEEAHQRHLFRTVLTEFLSIEDISDRVEQTGALLDRFGAWFDVGEVLALIPDGWSVGVVSGFLVGALRRLVAERRGTTIARALSGAENLRVNYDLVVEIDEKGPSIEAQN